MACRKMGTAILAISLILLSAPISGAQTISIATGEWKPFTSPGMQNYGKFTKRVTTVLKAMGIEPHYLFYPWGRCYDAVAKGRVWAAFPYSYTKKRAEKVWFSDKLSCSKTVFFYYDRGKSAVKYRYNSLKDIKAYKIGGVIGYFYEDSFKRAGLKVDYVNKEINAIEQLKIGRIDLLPINNLVGWDLIKTHFPEDAHNFKTLPKPLSINPLCLIVSKHYPGSKKLLQRFNRALRKCLVEGLIKIEKCE
jgi:polar amino acid transport system substrate-binding protein